MLGQLIVVLGSFCMVVMPPLMLFKDTRDLARRMLWTYLLGFLRYLVGSVLFNAIIAVAVMMAARGIASMLVSIIICFIMGKFGFQMMQEINMYINSTLGNKELRFMNRIYARAGMHRNGLRHGFRSPFKKNPATRAKPGTSDETSGGSDGTSGTGSGTGEGTGGSDTDRSIPNESAYGNQHAPIPAVDPDDEHIDNDDGQAPDASENDGANDPVPDNVDNIPEEKPDDSTSDKQPSADDEKPISDQSEKADESAEIDVEKPVVPACEKPVIPTSEKPIYSNKAFENEAQPVSSPTVQPVSPVTKIETDTQPVLPVIKPMKKCQNDLPVFDDNVQASMPMVSAKPVIATDEKQIVGDQGKKPKSTEYVVEKPVVPAGEKPLKPKKEIPVFDEPIPTVPIRKNDIGDDLQ